MSRHHKLLIALTFLMGFITGVFGYFWSQNADDGVVGESLPIEETGYEVLVTAYGGCERIGCPSFRLLDDGSYQYLAPVSVRDYARYEDTISERQLDLVTGLVESANFEELTETVFEGTCPVTYDGLAYRFDIRYESVRYSFDSCSESLDNEPLFIELVKYFAIMEATHGA